MDRLFLESICKAEVTDSHLWSTGQDTHSMLCCRAFFHFSCRSFRVTFHTGIPPKTRTLFYSCALGNGLHAGYRPTGWPWSMYLTLRSRRCFLEHVECGCYPVRRIRALNRFYLFNISHLPVQAQRRIENIALPLTWPTTQLSRRGKCTVRSTNKMTHITCQLLTRI